MVINKKQYVLKYNKKKHSMHQYINRKIILRDFITNLLCIILPLFILLSFLLGGQINNQKLQYENNIQKEALQLEKDLVNKLSTYIALSTAIFSSRWYLHYNTWSGLYNHEFDYIKQLEISAQIRSLLIPMEYVHDILIITPSLNNVINKYGWYTIKDYNNYYGCVNISVDSGSNKPVIIVPEEKTCDYFQLIISDPQERYHATVVAVVIDKKRFAGFINNNMNSDVEYAFITIEYDQVIYENGSFDIDGYQVKTISSTDPSLNMTLLYQNSRLLSSVIREFLLFYSIALSASLIIAIIMTLYNTQPLLNFLNRFPRKTFRSKGDAYIFWYCKVSYITHINEETIADNKLLNERLTTFFDKMRSEILFGIMTNPTLKLTEDMSIPWINKKLPYQVICIKNDPGTQLIFPVNSYAHIQSFYLPGSERCIVIWFKDMQHAKQSIEIVRETIDKYVDDSNLYGISPVLNDVYNMRKNFNLLQEKLHIPSKYSSTTQSIKKNCKNTNKTIELIREYIDNYYSDPDMSIKHLEAKFNLDGSYISKKFKVFVGMTFSDYLHNRRITAAMQMLRSTNKNLNTISETVGYLNYITFKRAFIRLKGISPNEYRKNGH
ncbi:MAG TPA: hypothetical protein DIW17_07830 [Clostridiales bacterium]|nr:hypothetical protein [Clostridiales bacterium]